MAEQVKAELLAEMGEYFGAGYFEMPEACPMRRWSRAVRRYWERRRFMAYEGEALWCWTSEPTSHLAVRHGQEDGVTLLRPSYSFTWDYLGDRLDDKLQGKTPEQQETLRAFDAIMRREDKARMVIDTVHTCGGRNYTHSIANYRRVINEGLSEHERRINEEMALAKELGDEAKQDFYLGLQDVLAGIKAFHQRLTAHLRQCHFDDAAKEGNRQRLVEAYERVPFEPARNFYEAMAGYSYTWMLDGCDNPGRMDSTLEPFYQADKAAGAITHNDAVTLVHEFNTHVSSMYGWSAAIGGRDGHGRPTFGEMTQICIEASHGCIRPSFELRVTPDMPDAIWEATLDAWASGCGQPAVYNEDLYLKALREMNLGISNDDLAMWNGGGCTETMIDGCSNVGSIEVGLHLALVFEEVLRENLGKASRFEQIIEALREAVKSTINMMVRQVNEQHQVAAALRPQPMRSLLIDDCIGRGVEYNAGGARYNWSVVSVAGLSNVADALAAIREVVFEKQEMSGEELLAVLRNNYDRQEDVRQRLLRCPKFGNDDPYVDELAAELGKLVFEEFRIYAPWRGGKFMPSCIMFETYGALGKMVGATPDGRKAGDALADSIGPMQGCDEHGPTAMVKSVTRLPLWLAPGTPVLNTRLGMKTLTSAEGRRKVRDLISTYFKLGGMQMQITVLDSKAMKDAVEHPEKHRDLIVRIGGYATWFNNLSDELKQEVIKRTEYLV